MRTPRTIAFIGVDGSGKTTQARLLRDHLKHHGASIVEAHSYGLKILKFVPDGVRRGDRSRYPGVASGGSARRMIALAEMFDVALYAWARFLWAHATSFRSRQPCWLVSDRAFADVVAKHLRLGTWPLPVLRAIHRLSPPIDLTIWLRIQPEIALARDGDFPLVYYQQADAAYQQLSRWTTLRVISTTSTSPEMVACHVRGMLDIDDRRRIEGNPDGRAVSQ